MDYHREEFSAAESAILSRYFTNLDSPVFALINLPEVIKSALFARYSRSAKSMRRLFLDEFVPRAEAGAEPAGAPAAADGLVDVKRGGELFDKIFSDYGDDSVAQLGGAHLACEQASNILTKVLEWGRLASYLEQSTRYILYDKPLGDSYRYGVPPEIAAGPLAALFRERMDLLFRTYAELVPPLTRRYEALHPRPADVAPGPWRASVRARVCDDLRGLLPAATLSNVGIFASGQAFEALLLRMRAHPLAEVREYGDRVLDELRTVIPSFVRRVEVADRGVRWSRYMADIDREMRKLGAAIDEPEAPRPAVTLVEWDPDGEVKVAAAALYRYCQLPDDHLLAIVRDMPKERRRAVIAAYCGVRTNRRHRPGRALERVFYRFDVVAPYSIFRDLQRHRMLTIEWQTLSTLHGYDVPAAVTAVGADAEWHAAMAAAADLHARLRAAHGEDVAQYAVPFGYRMRFCLHMNAREAFHLIELRTQRGGDNAYREICQQMHRLIAEQAGHTAIAGAMKFVDHASYELGRLESESRTAERRAARLAGDATPAGDAIPANDATPANGAPAPAAAGELNP